MQEIVIEELNNDSIPLTDGAINDALFTKPVELLAAQLSRINRRFESLNINSFSEKLANGFLSRLSRNNQKSMSSNIKNVTGIDLAGQINSSDVDKLLNIKISENVALITSFKNGFVEDIGKIIRDNVLDGQRSTRLITEIKERGNVSQSRAKLIARTETSKVNAQITQLRAEALGSRTYVWSTVIDERTRRDHVVMDGLTCQFGDNTTFSDDGGKTWRKRSEIGGVEILAGDIYNCRCTPLPIVNFG